MDINQSRMIERRHRDGLLRGVHHSPPFDNAPIWTTTSDGRILTACAFAPSLTGSASSKLTISPRIGFRFFPSAPSLKKLLMWKKYCSPEESVKKPNPRPSMNVVTCATISTFLFRRCRISQRLIRQNSLLLRSKHHV